MKVGDVVYWARIAPLVDTYEVNELRIRTVADTYFVGTDKDSSQAFLFSADDRGLVVFQDRESALALVKEAEKERRKDDKT